MKNPPPCSETVFGDRTLHAINMVVAVIGGLSLVVALAAPFNMLMAQWRSTADVLVAAAIFGGVPLACVSSILLSKWFFVNGRYSIALVVASLVPLLLVALLAWGIVSE